MVFCGNACSLVIFSGVSAGWRTNPAAASCPSFSGAPTLTQPAKAADAARAAKPIRTVLITASSFPRPQSATKTARTQAFDHYRGPAPMGGDLHPLPARLSIVSGLVNAAE